MSLSTIFGHVEIISYLLGLKQNYAAKIVSCSSTQYRNSDGHESQTSSIVIPSLKLFQLSHCALRNSCMQITELGPVVQEMLFLKLI